MQQKGLRAGAVAPANLASAWRRFAGHRGLWQIDQPMNRVRRDPTEAMLLLAEQLREARFVAQPPARFSVRKADGGCREIAVYPLRERVAQRAVLQVLQQCTNAQMAPLSFGFRPGRSVAGALAAAQSWINQGHWWLLDADVECCFDSIPRLRVLQEAQRRTGDADAADLIAECLGWHTVAERSGCGIPQGSCLGPWLCNVYLWRLDDAAAEDGVPLVRYADDFMAFLPTPEAARATLQRVHSVLHGLQLRLHPTKSRIVHVTQPVPFLGGRLDAARRLPAPASSR